MVNPDLFLDLKDVFVNELFGDVNLFIIVGLAVTWILALKAKIPPSGAVLLSVVFLMIFVATYYNMLIWVMVVFAAGVIFFYSLSKFISRR